MSIKFYRVNATFGFMSNYYRARFHIYGRWWNWVESPYQAMKTLDLAERDEIYQATKANDARLLGQKVSLRPNWDVIKRDVMKECCLAKFLQHADLRRQLMETGQEILIEDSPVDSYWGIGADGNGRNVLGQVLMEVRKELEGE